MSSDIIRKLHPELERLAPDAAMFLGDTNAVISCIAAAQLRKNYRSARSLTIEAVVIGERDEEREFWWIDDPEGKLPGATQSTMFDVR